MRPAGTWSDFICEREPIVNRYSPLYRVLARLACSRPDHYLEPVIVWFAVALWVVIVSWSLALMRAAGHAEAVHEEPSPPAPPRVLDARRQRLVVAAQGVLLAAVVAAAVLLSEQDQWEPWALVGLLAVLVLGSDFIVLDAKRFRIGGSFLGLVLVMAVLGPAPAVALGLASAAIDALRHRPRGSYLLNNLVTYAAFPLAGALTLAWLRGSPVGEDGAFAVAVLVVFIAANVLNFVMIAGHTVLLRGGSLRTMFRTVYLPVLPWELATASLTALAVYGFEVYGPAVVGLFVVSLATCQLLLRAVLRGQETEEEVERHRDQLDVRHEGMLGLLIETLALRDPSTARHAAATAHYALELARACELSEREQAVVHTAALLHDIGKEALPDHVLLGRRPLNEEERRLLERHPAEGARLLLRVEGLGEVATAVLAHHERIDGKGYPDGLTGDGIPMAARIIAIAEVYDVLTSEESYRSPLSAAEAEDELRRVAGAQLDGRLVWKFITQVLPGRLLEHEAQIADLEAELQVQRRVRGALDTPLVLGP
jgi:putative nucleotidyltransferase with HDIG domain